LPRQAAGRRQAVFAQEGAVADLLPLFPLGVVLFPGMLLPLHLFEERYRRLMSDRRDVDPVFGVVLTRRGHEVGEQPAIHAVGTAATLIGAGRYADGRWDVVVRGGRRFRVEGEDWSTSYLTGSVGWLEEQQGATSGQSIVDLLADVTDVWDRLLRMIGEATGVEISRDDPGDDPAAVAYAICARLPLDTWDRQRLLEAPTTADRLRLLRHLLRRDHALLRRVGAGGSPIERPGRRFSAN
jgi:Lon protease-like protein